MKFTQNKLFWLLQLSGWSFLFVNTWGKYVTNTSLDKTFIILEGILVVIIGIMWSSILRLYLKKHVVLDKVSTKNSINILTSFVVASTMLAASMFLAIPLYKLFHETPLNLSSMMVFSNILNAYIYMFFWLILYLGIKTYIRLKQVKLDQLTLLNALKESQLNTLKGQINPHFMFNCLNNIRGLMLEDVEKSRDMITRLSEILRYSLSHNNKDTINLFEEIEMVENTIELSKIQFEKRLTFSSDIDSQFNQFQIPPMTIQMLIENAIKHGISNQQQGGQISLRIFSENDFLKIIVINSGRLTKYSNTTQLGINNIRERLKLLYKDKAFIDLNEQDNTVHAIIGIPL